MIFTSNNRSHVTEQQHPNLYRVSALFTFFGMYKLHFGNQVFGTSKLINDK